MSVKSKPKRRGWTVGRTRAVEEGHRRARARRPHRAVRGPGAGRVAMAIKKHKPTTPGRRFATWSDREELTRSEPEKSLVEGITKSGGRNTHGRITSRATAAAAPSAGTAASTSSAARTACRRRSPRSSTTRTAPRTSRCSTTRDGEKRYILAPQRLTVGMEVQSGRDAEIQVGNCAAAGPDPDGHRDPQRRADARPRRPAGPLRRRRRSSSSRRRASARRCASPRARCAWCRRSAAPRSARSATPTTRTSRSARPAATVTRASARRRAARR